MEIENRMVVTQERINRHEPQPVTYDYQNEPIYSGEEIIETHDGDILRVEELNSYIKEYLLEVEGLTIKIA